MIARKPDNTLDIVETGVTRVAEHNNIASFRAIKSQNGFVDNRQFDAIGKLVNQNEIAHVK